jgi:hypothetical protein
MNIADNRVERQGGFDVSLRRKIGRDDATRNRPMRYANTIAKSQGAEKQKQSISGVQG